jgi:hypothetical protein
MLVNNSFPAVLQLATFSSYCTLRSLCIPSKAEAFQFASKCSIRERVVRGVSWPHEGVQGSGSYSDPDFACGRGRQRPDLDAPEENILFCYRVLSLVHLQETRGKVP